MSFDLELTDEQKALKDTLHDVAASVLRPAARDAEAAKQTPAEIARQIQEIGVAAPVPEEFGGGGSLDAVTYLIAAEELSWGDPGIAAQALGSGLAALVITEAGTDDQKKNYLPRFAEAEPAKTFVAVGEEIAAGDLESLETRIDGDKAVGEKYGVLNAGEAAFGIVVGRNGDGLGAVLMEPGAGFEVVKPEDKLGLEAAPTYVVRFDGIGQALKSGAQLDKGIMWAKLATGALALGTARAALEYAADYAKERQAFGKPIGAFQGVSFKIADMAILVDAARISLWRTAWKIDRGEATLADVAEANGQALAAAIQCGDD